MEEEVLVMVALLMVVVGEAAALEVEEATVTLGATEVMVVEVSFVLL